MFRWVIETSLRFRFLLLALGATMIAMGVGILREMPVDVFPEFAPPIVEIQTEGIGMSTAEVEELITIPMEETLRGTPAVDVVRSKTVTALSSIVLIFKRGTDLLRARQLVQERLSLAATRLPHGSSPPVMLQPLSSTSRMMKIGITSKNISLLDLSMTAYWKIRFRLLRVRGVANVAMWGERLKQLQVQVDPLHLRMHDVTLNQVMETVSDALDFGLLANTASAKTQTAGFIETPNQRFYITPVSPVIGPEDLAKVPLSTKSGTAVRLGDVAKLLWEEPLLIGDAVVNDGPGLLLIVEKYPWANTLEVTRAVEATLAELQPGLPDIEIDHEIFRPATFIETSIDNLSRALLIGAVLVVLVVVAFLLEWRVALISLVAIPLSLVSAGLVLYMRGATINTMVLAGFVVALGSIVDDAIIDVENIVRRIREARSAGNTQSIAAIIVNASLEIRSPIVYATLIIVLAVMPVFFMGGLSGAFFEPLVLSYSLALLSSLVVALTITPALCLILLDNRSSLHASPIAVWLQSRYVGVLSRLIRAPGRVFFAAGAVLLIGVATVPMLGHGLLPSFKERDFLMHWLTPPGTSHPEMQRVTVLASRELRSIPGVRNFGAHIGRALVADEVVGIDFTENWISIDPKADYDLTLSRVQETVDGYPGIYRDVQTYLRERIKEVLTGSSESIVLRIFGPDIHVLRKEAAKIKQALKGIDGLVDLHEELQKEVPQVQITVDLTRAAHVGLKPGDIRRAAALVFAGMEVSDIHRDNKVYDVMVWSTPASRRSLTSVKELLLDTPDGRHVRLGDVADVRIASVANVIKRENASRRIDVQANVRGRDLGSVVDDVEARLQSLQLPLGYHTELLGEAAERKNAQQQLFLWSLAAAAGMFLLLQAAFQSWRLAILAFIALPAALVGGVFAVYLGDRIISLGSLVGFLTVLGVAARNGILLIHHYQHLEQHEGQPFSAALVLRGARERLAPILMTTLATGLALVPLVATGNIPGQEIEHPMAVVILGGLVTSTLLNLFIVPAVYLLLGERDKRAAMAIPRHSAPLG